MKSILTFLCFTMLSISLVKGQVILDTTFNFPYGSNVAFTTGYGAMANVCAIQPDGKIVLAGIAGYNSEQVAIARFNSNGIIDSSFGINGQVRQDSNSVYNSSVNCIAIQPDGKIVVGGILNSNALLIRYNANGTYDSTFGVNGIDTLPGTGNNGSITSIGIMKSGKIVAICDVDNYIIYLTRINSNGTIDLNFGATGKVIPPNPNAFFEYLTLQQDDKIVIAGGYSPITYDVDIAVFRYDSTGAIDAGFANNGMTDFGITQYSNEYVYAVQVAPNGKIVVGGSTTAQGVTYQCVLLRYNANGNPDSSFNGTGANIFNYYNPYSNINAIAITPDEKILADIVNSAPEDGIMRFNNDGTIDSTYGAYFPSEEYVTSLALQKNGEVIGAGLLSNFGNNSIETFLVLRLFPEVIYTSTSVLKEFSNLKLYPNPSSGRIYVTGYPTNAKNIEVKDMLGRTIYSGLTEVNKTRIDIGTLPGGIYFMELEDESGNRMAIKFVKQ